MSVIRHTEDDMAAPHLFRTYGPQPGLSWGDLAALRSQAGRLAHLQSMKTSTGQTIQPEPPTTQPEPPHPQPIEQVLSLTELREFLNVSAQTIYDLRSQGRGPTGFRVGRELRFRISEIQRWLEGMEADDAQRHSLRVQ